MTLRWTQASPRMTRLPENPGSSWIAPHFVEAVAMIPLSRKYSA
jgi:hypothetical protein